MLSRPGRRAVLASLACALGCSSSGSTASPDTGAPTATATASVTATASSTAAATATASATAPRPSPASHVDGVSWAPAGDKVVTWCAAACDRPEGTPVAYHVADPFSGTVLTASIEDGGQERGASFSPKGTYLVGAAGNRIVIFKTADHSFSKVLDIEQMAVYGYMGLNDDETHFAWIDAFGFAEVVDLATGKALGRASLHDPNAGLQQQIAWVPGSSRVVFGCQESCTPELWGTKGKRISKLRVDGAEWGAHLDLATTPDGKIAVASADGVVALFDGKDGKGSVLRPKAKKKKDPNEEYGSTARAAIALSGDGKKLFVSTTKGDLTVFDIATKKATDVLAAKDGAVPIERMFASHDGSRVVIGDYTSSWEVPVAPNAVPEKLAGMAQGYSADGVLVVQAKDFVAGLLEGKEKWRRPRTGPGAKDDPPILAFSPDRKAVAIPDGQLSFVRASDGKAVTLALETKGGSRTLVPQGGASFADVAAVLGR